MRARLGRMRKSAHGAVFSAPFLDASSCAARSTAGEPAAGAPNCDSVTPEPIAAVVDEKIFCVHAGLSPDLNSPEQDRARVRDRVRDRVARPQLARAG